MPLYTKQSNSPLTNMFDVTRTKHSKPETSRPVLQPMVRLDKMDISTVELHRLALALRSGLLMESTWALDRLNILLRDDSTVSMCKLVNLPGLLDSLVEHWCDFRRVKEEIRGETRNLGRDNMSDMSGEKAVLLNRKLQCVTHVPDILLVEAKEAVTVGHIIKPGLGRQETLDMDCEAFNMVGEVEEQRLGKLCVVTTVLRNLSCVPGNETVMGSSTIFLSKCGEVLARHEEEDWHQEVEDVLVSLANIALQTDLALQPSSVVMDILSSLLFWTVSQSTSALDTFSHDTLLTPHKLSLEILCKLCLHQSNTDLLLATPPKDRLYMLCQVLAKKLYKYEDQSIREMSISLLHYIISASIALSLTISLNTPTIPLLISFIEHAELGAQHIARHQGVATLRDNPSSMGTSLATLRRAAHVLETLAQQPSTSSIFIREEQRLMDLAMSQILDQDVARSICEVLHLASIEDSKRRSVTVWGW